MTSNRLADGPGAPSRIAQAYGRVADGGRVWLRRGAAVVSGWPWFVQVILVFGMARAASAVVLWAAARKQGPNPWSDAAPDYLTFIGYWDSGWYKTIFDEGYPSELPRTPEGGVAENQWAFYVLFPAVVRFLHSWTGVEWSVLAPVTATSLGFAAALVAYRLFCLRATHTDAMWALAMVAFFPVAPILQIPYAESLHLFLLSAALYLVIRRWYAAAVPVVILMCLSRPAGVPFAAMVLAIAVLRLRGRAQDPLPAREAAGLGVLAVVSGLGAAAWPAIAWMVTGEPGAYVETETAWRGGPLVPFIPWFSAAENLLGPVLGVVAVVGLAAAAALILVSKPARRMGIELRLWCGAYILYLMAFWDPHTSTFRVLLPLFPLALAAVFASRSRAYRMVVLVMFFLLQIVWVTWLWAWAPIPGGGDFTP